ncbi:dienelactone hydrolase family protein [bacterium]|nr:dienelactone hydrolase family protein [bacterium]
MTGDIARQLLDGAHRFVDAQTAAAIKRRTEAFKAITANEVALGEWKLKAPHALSLVVGRIGNRMPAKGIELLATTRQSSVLFQCEKYEIHAVRWPVIREVHGEGLLIEPKGKNAPFDSVVVLAGESVTDQKLEFVAKLASAGVRVLIPVLIDRGHEHSLTQDGSFKTGLTNREFCYRPAFELGQHLIGYEIHKIEAAVENLRGGGGPRNKNTPFVGLIDVGGNGSLGLYAMAFARSLSFGQINLGNSMVVPMDQQPIDQNVFGLVNEFGFTELVSMIAPRRLILLESREWNRSKDRRTMSGERGGPSPTLLEDYPKTPEGDARWQKDAEELEEECFNKHSLAGDLSAWKAAVQKLQRGQIASSVSMCSNDEGPIDPTVLKHLGIDDETEATPAKGFSYTAYLNSRIGPQVKEIIDDTQYLLEEGPYQREQFWHKTEPARFKHDIKEWEAATKAYRDHFREKTIGHFDLKKLPAHPRTRQVYDTPAFTGYEVVLDVYPELIAYGVLLVPKGIKEGERRPVVVTQHGLEGRPQDVADPAINNPAYNQYGCRLAERGFVVFAPQNLYIFHDRFRHLQRKLNPIGKTLFSVIVPQHEQIVDWLETLPFVDGKRIGFYGLSYGGKSAMRIPALVEKYALSICSADFNDWVWKNASTRSPYSYVNTAEYEIFEFGLGPTFNYAEMAALIAPRPFMVERGHHDGVAPDDRVASEYAKIRLMYSDLGIPDRTEIEFFNGPHTIHGVGTFKFLHRHLNWPSPSDPVPLNK